MTQDQAVKLWHYATQEPVDGILSNDQIITQPTNFTSYLYMNDVKTKFELDLYSTNKYYKCDITNVVTFLRQWASALEGK